MEAAGKLVPTVHMAGPASRLAALRINGARDTAPQDARPERWETDGAYGIGGRPTNGVERHYHGHDWASQPYPTRSQVSETLTR